MEVFGSCSKYCTVKYAYSCIVFKYRVGSGSGPFFFRTRFPSKKGRNPKHCTFAPTFSSMLSQKLRPHYKVPAGRRGVGDFLHPPPPYGELRRLLPAGQWTGIPIHCPPVNGHGLESLIVMDQILYCHGEIYVRVQHNQLGMVPGQNL